jgi:hypothetical protein
MNEEQEMAELFKIVQQSQQYEGQFTPSQIRNIATRLRLRISSPVSDIPSDDEIEKWAERYWDEREVGAIIGAKWMRDKLRPAPVSGEQTTKGE